MEIKKIQLKNFRNYETEEFEFIGGVNIIHGDNAQGKTNILEAVYLFSMGKSHRTHREREMILFDNQFADVRLDFLSRGRENDAQIVIGRDKRKLIRVNGIPIEKVSALMGVFNAVLFCPEHLGLIKEGPRMRRKNLDFLISQLRPRYFSALLQYQKIVANKNIILKKRNNNNHTDAMVEIWNEQLISVASEIMRYRCEYIQNLKRIACDIQEDITNGAEELSIEYNSCIGEIDGMNLKDIRENLRNKLQKWQQKEFDYRECMVGPHRDDIEFYINGKEVRAFGSQGQQKTVVLTHKLSEVRLIREETGESPVLLLDDIMSELDIHRQEYVVRSINDMQVLITATEQEKFVSMQGDTKFFKINNGKIIS